MAPRKQTEAQTQTPAATAVANTTTKTVQGFAIGITAFIPVDVKDFRKQAEIPTLILDIQEGRKTIADLAPHLRQMDFRAQHTRKRVTMEEHDALFAAPEMTHTPENTDIDGEGRTADEAEEERPDWTPPTTADDETDGEE